MNNFNRNLLCSRMHLLIASAILLLRVKLFTTAGYNPLRGKMNKLCRVETPRIVSPINGDIYITEYRERLAIRRALYRCSWHDSRVCVNPNWHRKEWYHAGQQTYICAICERLNKYIDQRIA